MSDQGQSSGMNKIEAYLEQFAKGMLELKASQDRTDAQLRSTDTQLAKTIKKLDEIGRQLGDLGLVQGEVAEELFSGLFVLTQTDDGGAALLNRKGFKPKEFS